MAAAGMASKCARTLPPAAGEEAGLRPGATNHQFAAPLILPFTPNGIRTTLATITGGLGYSPTRTAAAVAVIAAVYGAWFQELAGLGPDLVAVPAELVRDDFVDRGPGPFLGR
ncbi:hypothetical protein [Streptomyces albipurpureus]|uniref:Uncharacterized protein n=1 Tax=Streptomyces albipurpureus TaxID=2897419 RepID=A0ABT0UQ98_9ACTN|nr:hypothetical protein [Streptomyces sp. CWNU-1]MCM2390763.1 hypothetical protein [Streptomyces sp. CWNU-1]